MSKPDPKPYLFEIGQKVRVKILLSEDGQTPKFWEGARAKVMSRYSTLMHKEHWYTLEHSQNGAQDNFKEEEIDRRYRQRNVH